MPIDPSIIGNVMAPAAPQLPDINAMLETQTRGAENIYKIERQRQADAAAAQEAAAADQEAATIKALLPAYTYGIQTGDMAGALNLVPPEMQEGLRPYVDALAGKSPDEVKAALIGSLSSSAMGQEALAAIQRAGTLSVQQGQLAVSREDIALRRQKQALDAQGQGAWELKEGEGGFFWTNPRTREVVPADVTGGAVLNATPGAVPAPSLVMPRQPAPGAPAVAPSIGAAQPPSEFRPKPKGSSSTEQTQEERRRAASVRYTVKNAERVAEIIDKDPAAFGQGADEFVLSLLPFGAGEDFMAFAQDANREQLNYRMTQIVATLLRLETGAAYTKPELVTEAKSFMQTYGDDPETARDKIDALKDRVSSAVGSTGRAWTPEDQAEYEAAMMALETMKDKLYPAGDSGGEADAELDALLNKYLPQQ